LSSLSKKRRIKKGGSSSDAATKIKPDQLEFNEFLFDHASVIFFS